MRDLTRAEQCTLRLVQGTLPDSATPFDDVAAAVSAELGETVSEEAVLMLLQELKDGGQIRRFGATLRHQKAGWGANAMVAWEADSEAEALRLGPELARCAQVSHCYYRPGCPEWPYSLYTMVHGRSRESCLSAVERLARDVGLSRYAVLFSVQERKKTSMVYF